ncbi:IS3 family transposase [Endozoicomonas sp. SESOKO3]|uniref:IS3 family transposase n=2 Tax=unclassified Endozoicomonas TaxID=2644528 RepID=UPI002149930D|nr:IS3 family transposase [Endozoicomonas sp. SESOKO3]
MAKVPCGTTQEKFSFIARFKDRFGVQRLCQRFNVSRSGLYAWNIRTPGIRQQSDVKLLKRITALFKKYKGRYGSPRLFKTLRLQGICVSRKCVERMMINAGLVGRKTRIYRRNHCRPVWTSLQKTSAKTSPNPQLSISIGSEM